MPNTVFHSDVDGFAFANNWRFDDVEKQKVRALHKQAITFAKVLLGAPALLLTLPSLKTQLFSWVDQMLIEPYGMCGGMAFAALDYFLQPDRSLPRGVTDEQPDRLTEQGERLRSYIWERLLHSLALNVHTFLFWMFMLHHVPERRFFGGGPPWITRRTYHHWGRLKKHIDSGTPWPIGLIGTTTDPTLNHQVLAVGYDDPGDGTGVIYVYDMNCPGTERAIHFKLTSNHFEVKQEDCPSTARGPLQGFFCEVYQRHPDPPIIDLE